ncbi:sigma-70 family RNA polymerase sigma factor [Paenibacillus flagellatus]|uniref:sigma-70 family RNA polymerase sigma factor n=1 Tax=Paenibacillus flagellatus TaxID=2211139 RepID=UPI001FE7C6E1|nr:sigma-70 family RNA polymerase sigma factor [Paenibacillus flagellatus]
MKEWVEAAMRGDRDSFEKLVARYRPMTLAVARSRLNDAHLAEDAVQESFAEAYRGIGALADPEAFPGWLKRIVERQCGRMTRRKRIATVPLDSVPDAVASAASPAEALLAKEERGRIRARIDALPPGQRIAVLLFYMHDYSLGEISAFLGVPVSALKKRLFDARRKLRTSLPIANPVSVFRTLYEGGVQMLHIVNGDAVGDKLKQGGVPGDVLVWRELYSEGPVFPDMDGEDRLSIRADWLERTLGIPQDVWRAHTAAQESALSNAGQYGEIVLWFEHDPFDQAMLAYLFRRLAGVPLSGTKISLLQIGAFPGIEPFRGLGQLSAGQLASLCGTWREIGPDELALGSRAWEAYASPDPRALTALLETDTSALPFLRDAFRHHADRFPSAADGLGSVERATLAAVLDGCESPLDLFRRVGDELNGLGMGDLAFWAYARDMTRGPHPLLRLEGAAAFPGFAEPPGDFGRARLVPTDLGRRMATAPDGDWIALNGIDRWLGGVRLSGSRSVWRRDGRNGSFVRG